MTKRELWKKLWKVWITICRKELLKKLCKLPKKTFRAGKVPEKPRGKEQFAWRDVGKNCKIKFLNTNCIFLSGIHGETAEKSVDEEEKVC